jgi:hypothetical protein
MKEREQSYEKQKQNEIINKYTQRKRKAEEVMVNGRKTNYPFKD